MADICMHLFLAEDVEDKCQKKLNKIALNLGSLGPDPFFHHIKDHRYAQLANKMHNKNTRDFFIEMINEVKNDYSLNKYSYLIGYICHYALDVMIHPYIFNKTGVYNKNDASTYKYRGQHLRFERGVDAAFIQKRLHIKPHKLSIYKTFLKSKKAPYDVFHMVDGLTKKVYNDEYTSYQLAVSKMNKNLKYLTNDPLGIKKLLYSVIDLFHKKDIFFSDLSYYNIQKNVNYLNDEHSPYSHPVTNEEFTYSVDDMYQRALKEACKIIDDVDLYLKNENVDLYKTFQNLSFDTALDCDGKQEMIYFDFYKEK